MKRLTAPELAAWLADPARDKPLLLDVREEWEFEHVSLPGSHHLPLGELPAGEPDLDPDQPVVCICHHGVRSLQAAAFLQHRGFTQVHDLIGGIDAWSREVDPGVARY